MKFFYINIISVLLISTLNAQEINIQNITSEDLSKAREFLENDISPLQNENEKNNDESKEESIKKIDEKKSQLSSIDQYKYGYNFISTAPTSIVASTDLPLPNDYKISLGDRIGVILTGSKNKIFDMKVQLDGSIFFPELGTLNVVGISFDDLKNRLKNLVSQSYIGVNIDVSLKDLSAKKITIVGAVNNPGTYLVNPFTTISNALSYSGGIQEVGSLRSIKLIRTDGKVFKFDLYDLLIYGRRSDDITIESGDVIIIGPAKKFVSIKGLVNRPAIYELTDKEDLSDLVDYALGFSGNANLNKITINKLNPKTKDIEVRMINNINESLEDVISVNVFPYTNKTVHGIRVEGAIKETGFYSIDKYDTLDKLIAELVFSNVYPWLAVLEQFDENNLVKTSLLFNLKDPNTFNSVKLLPNSRVYFANRHTMSFDVSNRTKQLINDYRLRINHKQGFFEMPVYGRFEVKSFIDFLGLDMSDVNDEATYVSPLESVVVVDNYKNMQYQAKKYNTISFRSPVNDLIRVKITGAVDYPDSYVLKADSTLEDLYKLVGDFRKEAFLDGIIFTRESIRDRQIQSIAKSKADLNEAILASTQKGERIGDINIIRALSQSIDPENLGRIAGDFSPNSLSSRNTTLLDGDKIHIPVNPNIVSVLGEVMNPLSFEYEKGISVREAISRAGGYKDFSDKGSVYVIKASGLIEKANRNIFVRNLNLEPGDAVIVPRKIITNNPGVQALLPITQILSDVAFTAAALDNLRKN
jgi:polysaccharide export outer membrane protein